MRRHRLIVSSSIVLIALVGGACGTSRPSGRSSTPTTTAKLRLAGTGRSAAPSADASAGSTAIYRVGPTRYVLDGTLADLGTSAPVLRLDAHPVTEADVQRFADALGLTGSPVRTPGGWEVRSADALLTVDTANGAPQISFSRGVPNSVDGSTGSGSSSSGSSGPGVAPTPGSVVAT